MKNFLCEGVLTLSEAARIFPGHPHPNTLRRWHKRGFKGVKLQFWRVGKRWVTNRDAIQQFLAAINSLPHSANARREAADRLSRFGIHDRA